MLCQIVVGPQLFVPYDTLYLYRMTHWLINRLDWLTRWLINRLDRLTRWLINHFYVYHAG